MTIDEVLQNCTINGLVVKLPEVQLDRKEYLQVVKKLELIGGKWKGGKVSGFVFQSDPTELLEKIQGGENVNLKKEYQFFATPDEIAMDLVELACGNDENTWLEPSGGQGAIIDAIHRQYDVTVDTYELMELNRSILQKKNRVSVLGDDFLQAPNKLYDRIVANPPFSKNQDIDHILKMYDLLTPDGILVTIASNHWKHSSFKKETAFREWLKDVSAEIIDIEAGAFKESGTNISSCIIKIVKR